MTRSSPSKTKFNSRVLRDFNVVAVESLQTDKHGKSVRPDSVRVSRWEGNRVWMDLLITIISPMMLLECMPGRHALRPILILSFRSAEKRLGDGIAVIPRLQMLFVSKSE